MTDSQVSYFTSNIDTIRGKHYHHTKVEKFFIVDGVAEFKFTNINDNSVFRETISHIDNKVIESIPGVAHEIKNVGDVELKVVIWANEVFNEKSPDTFLLCNFMKVMTIIGTRPELIRLSRVIPALDKKFEHILIHTNQNNDYELNEIFFKDLSLRRPDQYLDVSSDTLAEQMSKIILQTDDAFQKYKPDALLVLGDTNSCLSVIPAKRRKIPIFHMEAGNRCYDLNVPEEINRKIVDHTSDINMPYSKIAREHLLLEGIKPNFIIRTGSPIREVLEFYSKKINQSKVLEKLDLDKNKYFLVSCHREENISSEDNLMGLVKLFDNITDKYNLPIIFSTHPRTKKTLENKKIKLNKNVKSIKPLSFTDYNYLQMNACLTFSDSGTINEEVSVLKFKAINIRDTHERPEAMEEMSLHLLV